MATMVPRTPPAPSPARSSSPRPGPQGLSARSYLERNDSYTYFQEIGGLLKTGPTNTNVCDLQIVLIDPRIVPGTSLRSTALTRQDLWRSSLICCDTLPGQYPIR